MKILPIIFLMLTTACAGNNFDHEAISSNEVDVTPEPDGYMAIQMQSSDGYCGGCGPSVKTSITKSPSQLVFGPDHNVIRTSRCKTGPRGGTYTITSGGNKNYGGC